MLSLWLQKNGSRPNKNLNWITWSMRFFLILSFGQGHHFLTASFLAPVPN